ncbi:Exocyst complex component 2, partial [Blattella germanica]
KKFPEDDLHELFPEGSGDLSSEQFVAGWFLLEHHHATTFDDLRAGLSFLRRKVDGQKEGQLSFLKANVSSVMDQLDTLMILKDRFEADVKEHGPDPTIKVEKAIQESMLEANKLFEEVLARRDRADATRNALGVLQRFKFLFSLPVSIERNIRKGDYDVVINDYARAKNLFSKTDVADMPSTLEEQKKIIRNLVNLEATGDPAWDGISCHSTYISQRLNACKDEHIAAETAPTEDSGKNSKAGMQTTPMSSKFNKTPNNNSQPQDWQSSVPQRILFVEELTEIVTDRFPDLWKLGQAYFTGELHVRVEPGRQAQFKRMVLTAIELFSGLLRAAILPHTLDRMSVQRQTYGTWPSQGLEGVGPWLPHCLRYVRSTYKLNRKLNYVFILHYRLHCMSTLFQQASEHVKSLHKRETWKIEFDSKHGGITSLSLENFAFSNEMMNQDDHSPAVSQLIGAPAVYRGREKEGSGPAWEQRLLTTLSNCQYTAKVVLPRLSEFFTRHGYPSPILPIATATNALNTLDRRILEVYLEQKSDPLVGTIEPSMYLGRFDWDTPRKPTDIRPYAKEIIANMIGVHAEVHRVSPNLVHRVLTQIVETVAEELSRLMSCVTRFSVEGNQQARADILAVQETVKLFTTPSAQSFFEEALEAIPPLTKSTEKKVVEDVLANFRVRMRLQLMCFGDHKNQQNAGGLSM